MHKIPTILTKAEKGVSDMDKNQLCAHIDELLRYAKRRCGEEMAEDLVSDTILRALYYLDCGGTIDKPAEWLRGTLNHLWNDALRKKYKMPMVVELESAWDIADNEDPYAAFTETDEAAEVRREVTYLARQTREILIRFYFSGDSVAKIASDFGIPEGTVKSRLDTGRRQVKKGMEDMEEHTTHAMPSTLRITFSGGGGRDGMPMSMVENDLIVQNLLIHAYEKPVTVQNLARTVGIPTVYIEPIVDKLVRAELMKRTDGGLVYTDFMIYTPQNTQERFDEQLAFCHERFDEFWKPAAELIEKLYALDWMQEMNPRQKMKAERFTVLRALQKFCLDKRGLKEDEPRKTERPDGGSWTAFGFSYPPGFDSDTEKKYRHYSILGGHRSCIRGDVPGAKQVATFEFDTPMWDYSCRYCAGVEMADTYFMNIHKILWKVYKNERPTAEDGIPESMIEAIPEYVETGLLAAGKDGLKLDIPYMNETQYVQLMSLVDESVEALDRAVGEDFRAFVKKGRIPIPAHIDSVPIGLQYRNSTVYMEMAIVREAYEKGLHMKGVDFVCPPMIVVFVE